MKEIKNKIFPFIIALSALSVSASAAFYSVTGLSKLFAGAETQVIIMAGSLEVAKLVIASLLYQYWNDINKALRTYLIVASVVLVLITSMGIYGYLSAAYQVTTTQVGIANAQVELLETKKQNLIQQRDLYSTEKNNLIQGISQLQGGLVNNKTSHVDKRGNLIQSTSNSNRKSFERQLDNSTSRQNEITIKLDTLNNQIYKLDTQIVETKAGNDKAGELGPLIYLSTLTGIAMDRIINYLLLVIIFVFDPLAIALVIAANFAFAQLRPKQEDIDLETEWKDFDLLVNDGLELEPWYDEETSHRMDIIGQNGNEGEHYEEFEPLTQEEDLGEWSHIKHHDLIEEDVVPQEEERILPPDPGFGGGNFRVRPPQDENIIDYN